MADPQARTDEQLVFQGQPLKVLGTYTKGGAEYAKLGGYLVVFSGPDSPDLTGDFFTAKTDFGTLSRKGRAEVPGYYQHGFDPYFKGAAIGDAELSSDAYGVWAEYQIELRSEYERHLIDMASKGLMGQSSGAVGHLVEMKAVTGDVYEITRWPIGEASLTPTPAEPRTSAQPLKAFKAWAETQDALAQDEPAAPAPEAPAAVKTESPTPTVEPMENEKNTTETAVETPTKAAPETPAVDVNAIAAAAAQQAAEATMKAYRESQTPTVPVKAQYEITDPAKAISENRAPRELEDAFHGYVRGDVSNAEYRKAIKMYAKAAMQEGTDSEGGYFVPDQYSNDLIVAMKDASILRTAGARILTVTGSDTLRMPSLTYSGAAALTAEEAAFDQKEPTAGEIVFNAYKYTKLSKVSDELLEDSRIPVVSEVLIPDAVQAFAAAENSAFTVGTGSSQPEGVVTGATTGVTAASTTAITADEIIDLYHSLNYLYRQDAVWMMNDATAKLIRKLKDGDNQYLWQPGLQAGQPDRLLGRPVFTNNSMATGAANAKTVLFGDMRYFAIADFAGGGAQLRRLNELYAANGQVGFRWYKRFDSNVLLAEAIQVLAQAAS